MKNHRSGDNHDSATTESGPTTATAPDSSGIWARARMILSLQRKVLAGSSLVEIQPRGTKPPLFLVHGVGGGMLWGYDNLARHLGKDQPLFAFKSRGTDGLEEFKSIEAMAAHYVRELREFQPVGPYQLGGFCFGGNVAYEMARLLLAQNQQVGLLCLLNCWPNNSSYTRLHWTPLFLAKFLWNVFWRLQHKLQRGANRPRDFFKWRAGWFRKKLRVLWSGKGESRWAVEDIVDLSTTPEHERRLWRQHVEAWLKFQPKPYPGPLVLLRTRGHPLICSYDNQMGWGAFAQGGVTVNICRGDHESILEEENAEYTARQLEAFLTPRAPEAAAHPAPAIAHEALQPAAKTVYAVGACKLGVISNLE